MINGLDQQLINDAVRGAVEDALPKRELFAAIILSGLIALDSDSYGYIGNMYDDAIDKADKLIKKLEKSQK